MKKNIEGNIVAQTVWDDSYKNFDFFVAEDDVTNFIDKEIDKIIRNNELYISNCFEVGCFPGRYLAHFSEKYKLYSNGVDATSEVNDKFLKWLNNYGNGVEDIFKADAFEVIDKLKKQGKKYDFVYSFGFVEHFEQYENVIRLHCDIVRDGGLLVITAPNFRGWLQKIMHLTVDKKNVDRHVLKSMNPKEWREILEREGYKICFCGYFGGFDFWVDNQKRNFVQKILLKIYYKITKLLKKVIKTDRKGYSPYCAIVAIKNN